MDINTRLKNVIGKKITINYYNGDGTPYYTSGILDEVEDDVISMTIFDKFNKALKLYINRRSCTLLNWIVEPD